MGRLPHAPATIPTDKTQTPTAYNGLPHGRVTASSSSIWFTADPREARKNSTPAPRYGALRAF
eukprot:7952203-Lingulodinium_polyedra.AAC.1